MTAFKEAQMREIREISKLNSEKIRKMKKEEQMKNQYKAHNVRKAHASRVEQQRMEKEQ
jgi:hypothetical protein